MSDATTASSGLGLAQRFGETSLDDDGGYWPQRSDTGILAPQRSQQSRYESLAEAGRKNLWRTIGEIADGFETGA